MKSKLLSGLLEWRFLLTLFVSLLALIFVLPTFLDSGSKLKKYLPDNIINLGLDLKGGVHLTLGVEIDKAIAITLDQRGQDIRSISREEGIRLGKPRVLKGEKIEFVLEDGAQREKLADLLDKHFSSFPVADSSDLDGGKVKYILEIDSEYRSYLANLTLDQAVMTIRNRLDPEGVKELDIRKQQDFRIQVQIPGEEDPERVVKLVQATGHLEFRLVDDEADLEKALKGQVHPSNEVLPYMDTHAVNGASQKRFIVLKKTVELTGETIVDANVQFDTSRFNEPYVSMTFNSRGARKFERVTGDNIGKRLAIVLDGAVRSAPVIQSKIPGGRAQITGRFTPEEARDLAIVLRSGAMPAPVKVLEERSIGPSLGQESIDKGVKSAMIGGALILLFMAVYYGFAGLVADSVLILNILLIMAGLSAFNATLTLPGIAGIILTIGMAVDANVLIFERIREELRKGLTSRAAVNEGFGRATLTILDANVTTVIAAVILYQFGTGPIRGFAVTLTLGIMASMFTAIFVSRILFDLWVSRKPEAKLSI